MFGRLEPSHLAVAFAACVLGWRVTMTLKRAGIMSSRSETSSPSLTQAVAAGAALLARSTTTFHPPDHAKRSPVERIMDRRTSIVVPVRSTRGDIPKPSSSAPVAQVSGITPSRNDGQRNEPGGLRDAWSPEPGPCRPRTTTSPGRPALHRKHIDHAAEPWVRAQRLAAPLPRARPSPCGNRPASSRSGPSRPRRELIMLLPSARLASLPRQRRARPPAAFHARLTIAPTRISARPLRPAQPSQPAPPTSPAQSRARPTSRSRGP